MVSTFSSNIQLEEPARGDQVGVWDTPVNSNMTVLDLITGGSVTIGLNNSPVVLASGQFQSKAITFNSTLTGSVAITFPTSFKKSYEIYHTCTGSSAFVITLQTTAAGGQAVCCPPGEVFEIWNDGANIRFKNFGRVGSYWDYSGSSVPAWVTGCTVPPYLNCTGAAFSSATYPTLAGILGGTTLPDARSRARFTLDQGAARLSSAVAGFNPNTVGNAGGDQNFQQHNHGITDPGHTHIETGSPAGGASNHIFMPNNGTSGVVANSADVTASSTTGITINNAGTGQSGNIPPAYIGGLTLIRAA